MPVEIERDRAVDVGAVDASSGIREASESFIARQAERVTGSHRNYGELGLRRIDQL
jgi:hypothetical protein